MKKKEFSRDENGRVTMSTENLKIVCENDRLYSEPSLNDILYLHYKGFNKIGNLDEYTNLHSITLNNNGFTKIEGLEY